MAERHQRLHCGDDKFVAWHVRFFGGASHALHAWFFQRADPARPAGRIMSVHRVLVPIIPLTSSAEPAKALIGDCGKINFGAVLGRVPVSAKLF